MSREIDGVRKEEDRLTATHSAATYTTIKKEKDCGWVQRLTTVTYCPLHISVNLQIYMAGCFLFFYCPGHYNLYDYRNIFLSSPFCVRHKFLAHLHVPDYRKYREERNHRDSGLARQNFNGRTNFLIVLLYAAVKSYTYKERLWHSGSN